MFRFVCVCHHCCCSWVCRAVAFPADRAAVSSPTAQTTPGKFVDVTAALGVHFKNLSSHTSKKYLIETMGAGVALFDYDNDGRLDIYLGQRRAAERSHAERHDPAEDRTRNIGIACTIRNQTGRSKTSLKRRACRARATEWEWPSATTTMTATKICSSPRMAATSSITTMATALSRT